jgi:hypothetical protein
LRDTGQVELINEKKKRARQTEEKRARLKGALLAVLGAAMMALSIVFGGPPFLL